MTKSHTSYREPPLSRQPSGGGSRSASKGTLTRNAYINFIGQIAAIPVAIIAIPLLIKVLGTERFGVLALAWIVMGYFGLFDFGLGRATTKFVAEYKARNETDSLPELIWSSMVFHAVLGVAGGILLAVLTPWLTNDVLNVPNSLLYETRISFYLLAVSVPLVVITASLRGVLEALQRFDMVNVVKIPASILNYLGPVAVLYFVRGLVPVVGFLVVSRLVVLMAHFFLCLRAMPELSQGFRFNASRMKPLVGFGGWLTVSSFIVPTIVSMDRFMIGAFVSLSAVALYATPYEVVTKLTVFSTGLLAVLFPAFSVLAVERAGELRKLYFRAFKYLLVLVAPIVGVLLALAYELLSLWVAPGFAERSAPVAQWMAIGILLNVLGQVPFTALQGIGRADVTAKLQLAQLPFYALAVWYMVSTMGIVGVAIVWALRGLVGAVTMFVAADRLLPQADQGSGAHYFGSGILVVSGTLLLFVGIGWVFSDLLLVKVAAVTVLLALLLFWEWRFFLGVEDRKTFTDGARSLLVRKRDTI